MGPDQLPSHERADIDECTRRSVALLRNNLSSAGIGAATPSEAARARSYCAIFGRDASICALGMAVSGDPLLERAAARGLVTLAENQARNGQIPNFVAVDREEVDFWYVGCIDATLWWLIAVALLDGADPARSLRQSFAAHVDAALEWLACQEHQRFFLLQQNEASDWADIMPRSGFVLYTNALWHRVKTLYGLAQAAETRRNANRLFHPFDNAFDDYRRGRLLMHYARRNVHDGDPFKRDLYLSFVNLSCCGDEGDAFGNILAILCGLADDSATRRTLHALRAARIDDPFPVRAVCTPISRGSERWRAYMSRHRQNEPWQYQNGGIWPFVGGFLVGALVQAGMHAEASEVLAKFAQANAVADWAFAEWLHGLTGEARGMRGQSWNAAMFLLARHTVNSRTPML